MKILLMVVFLFFFFSSKLNPGSIFPSGLGIIWFRRPDAGSDLDSGKSKAFFLSIWLLVPLLIVGHYVFKNQQKKNFTIRTPIFSGNILHYFVITY
jgi:hypothetical protein